jgi:hypothetical protein
LWRRSGEGVEVEDRLPPTAQPVILVDMDQDRADYFDYDNPPDRDLRFDWRAASAVGGLVLMAILIAVLGVVTKMVLLR